MKNRSFSASEYRFGFNTQERESEINQDVYTAMFWEYDGRLARRWNLDPVVMAYLSSYCVLANNGILFVDPYGDKFKLPTNDAQARKDIESIVKNKNLKYLDFKEDGSVEIDFKGASIKKIGKILKNDIGLNTIFQLSIAKKDNGKDYQFYYATQGITNLVKEGPSKANDYYKDASTLNNKGEPYPDEFGGYKNFQAFVIAGSIEPYDDPKYMFRSSKDKQKFGFRPNDKYDGKVFICRGKFCEIRYGGHNVYNDETGGYNYVRGLFKDVVPRSNIVLHELRENLYRTVHHLPYEIAHELAGGDFRQNESQLRFYPEID
jgi:hypothetical protein